MKFSIAAFIPFIRWTYAVAGLLASFGAYGQTGGTFEGNVNAPPINNPASGYMVYQCDWSMGSPRWDQMQRKWVYPLRASAFVKNDGMPWLWDMYVQFDIVTPGGSGGGFVLAKVGPNPEVIGASPFLGGTATLSPSTEVRIAETVFNGGGPVIVRSQYFTTPPAPLWDTLATAAWDVKAVCAAPPRGMAVANVHAMLCSLNISDIPLSYVPPFGPPVDFGLTYNQREASLPGTFDFSNLGPNWTHNWLGFVDETIRTVAPAWPGNAYHTPPIPGYPATNAITIKIAFPGGGGEDYADSVPFTEGSPIPALSFVCQSDSRITMSRTGAGYERRMPDGSKLVFGHLVGGSRYLLTQVVDRFGQALTLGYDASHRIVSVTDAAGGVSTLAYELAGAPLKITKMTDPFGRSALIDYDSSGRLRKITDILGLTSEFTYQGAFIDSMITPYGTSTFAFGETASTRWVTLTDPQGGVERVEYRDQLATSLALGPLPAGMSTSPSDDTLRFTLYWDKKAMLEKPGDPSAAHLYHWLQGARYGTSRMLMEEKNPLENRVFYNYDGQTAANFEGTSGRRTAVGRVLDDSTTQLTRAAYDAFGNLVQSIDPLGRQTDFLYAANGLDLLEVHQKTGSAGEHDVLAKFAYNAEHRPLTVTDAAGQVTTFTYNAAGQVRTIVNAKNEVTTLWYHPTGQTATPSLDAAATGYLVQADGALAGATTKILYDASGRPRTVTDSDGYAVTTDYDAFDRPTRVTYPDATYEEIGYNRLDAVTTRDRRGRITRMDYNAVRQLVKTTDPLFRVTRYDWCKCGALVSLLDPAGQLIAWDYDIQGRVTAKRYADESAVSYTYEAATSRLKTVVDAKGQAANYAYFGDDALKQVSYTNATVATPTVSFTYDPNYPRVATMTDGVGTTTYAYNPVPAAPTPGAGRLAATDGPFANDTISYTYDELGRMLTRSINGAANSSGVTYDVLGRVTALTNALGAFGLAYVNATGRLDHVDYPNGQRTNYGYFNNAADRRLQQIQNLKPGGANLSTFGYTYDLAGVIQTWSKQIDNLAMATSGFEYDLVDQLTGASVPGVAAAVKNYVYRYDRAGNRASEQIDNAVTSATHNEVNQLTALSGTGPIRFAGALNEPATVTVSGQPATVDAANRFSADVPLAPGIRTVAVTATDASGNAATKNYQVTVASGVSRSLSYDANGNLLGNGAGQTYAWDAANRLVKITQASGVTEFVYDGQSRRVQEKFNGAVIKQWVWCEGPQPCEERDGSNAVTKRFFGGLGEQFALNAHPSTLSSFYFTTDHLGSVREMTDGAGAVRARYDYDPYGRVTKLSGDLEADFGFTGFHRHQASGLSLTLYRAYDAEAGRWLSRDPIQELGGLNIYAYVENNPVNAVDLLGMWSTPIHNAIADNAFSKILSPRQISIIKDRSKKVDAIFNLGQALPNSFQHGMRAPWESVADAKALYERYIRIHLIRAQKAQAEWNAAGNCGYSDKALDEYGYVFHAITDSVSPSHVGFKKWNFHPIDMFFHSKSEEVIYPNEMRKAVEVARDYFNRIQP